MESGHGKQATSWSREVKRGHAALLPPAQGHVQHCSAPQTRDTRRPQRGRAARQVRFNHLALEEPNTEILTATRSRDYEALEKRIPLNPFSPPPPDCTWCCHFLNDQTPALSHRPYPSLGFTAELLQKLDRQLQTLGAQPAPSHTSRRGFPTHPRISNNIFVTLSDFKIPHACFCLHSA